MSSLSELLKYLGWPTERIFYVCASDFPEPDLVADHLRKAHEFGHTLVVRGKDRQLLGTKDKPGPLKELPHEAIFPDDPGLARRKHPLWKTVSASWLDGAKKMRDVAIAQSVDRIVVFHTPNSADTKWWTEKHGSAIINVIERGEKKQVKRKATKARAE